MANEATKTGDELLKELLTTQPSAAVLELAKKIIEANKRFDEELDRCMKVDTEVLRRKITV